MSSGFTIMELLVAFSIAGFMILVFHAIFNEATTAARRNIQGSDILHKAMAFEEQVRYETKLKYTNLDNIDTPGVLTDTTAYTGESAMLGPRGNASDPHSTPDQPPGGILVIVQHAVPNVSISSNRERFFNTSNTQLFADVRDDQLLFIYDQRAQGGQRKLTPLAPAWQDSYGGDIRFSRDSDFVRIWYGHVAQTNADGSFNQATDDLGLASGVNAHAADWTLGRHVLFTAGDDDNDGVANLPAAEYQDYYVETGGQGSFGSTLGLSPNDNVQGYGTQKMYLGLADVTARPWTDITMNTFSAGAPAPDGSSGLPAYLGGDDISISDANIYNARALAMTFYNARMRVMTAPDLSNSSTALANFTPWTVARAHPIFLPNVSDFIVEFAHDYFTDTEYNPASPQPDGRIDTYINAAGQSEVRWYNLDPNNTWGGLANGPGSGDDPSATTLINRGYADDNDFPITWLPPINANNPAHVSSGGGLYDGLGAFVWGQYNSQGYQEGKEDSAITGSTDSALIHRWPWLIRIRYRIHDKEGKFVGRTLNEFDGIDGNSLQELGQWYEIIVPVNNQALPVP